MSKHPNGGIPTKYPDCVQQRPEPSDRTAQSTDGLDKLIGREIELSLLPDNHPEVKEAIEDVALV